MKTKFRVFTALLLALMVLVSVLPLQAAAEIGQSGTATRAEAENTAEAALSVKPMLTPSYTPSASYRSGKYYTYSALQCFAYGQPAHRPCECCAQPAWVS